MGNVPLYLLYSIINEFGGKLFPKQIELNIMRFHQYSYNLNIGYKPAQRKGKIRIIG